MLNGEDFYKSKILMVDDEPGILKTVGKILEVAGFDLLTAGDGESGLLKARTEHPDGIILDLMMPGLSGLEVCAELRKDASCRQIPVILFSGKGKELNNRQLYEWGANAFLSKTLGTKALVDKVRELLNTS